MKGCTRQEDLGRTRYLVVTDVMKRQSSGKNEEERKKHTITFLGAKVLDHLGCSRPRRREDRTCHWCSPSSPVFLLEEDLAYWDWDHVEDEDLDEFRHWGKRDYL